MNTKYGMIALALLTAVCLTGCSEQTAFTQDSSSVADTTEALSYHQISQDEAKEMMRREASQIILDVRTQEEYDAGHIPGAILIPNETITDTPPEELPMLDQIILIYCRSGNRSKQAAEKLAAMGYTNIYEFGGINTWDGEIVTEETFEASTEPETVTESITEPETMAETLKETYSQSYPVQDWQRAYAKILMSSTAKHCVGTGYLIHLDEDSIPELLILEYMDSGMAGLFSFDGTESYFVDYCTMGYYTYDVQYRPYLSMLGYNTGSVMSEGAYNYVMTFGKDENGKIFSTGIIQLDDNGHAPDGDYESVDTYEGFALYDAPSGQFGESWRTVGPEGDIHEVTQVQIEYWLGDTSEDTKANE